MEAVTRTRNAGGELAISECIVVDVRSRGYASSSSVIARLCARHVRSTQTAVEKCREDARRWAKCGRPIKRVPFTATMILA